MNLQQVLDKMRLSKVRFPSIDNVANFDIQVEYPLKPEFQDSVLEPIAKGVFREKTPNGELYFFEDLDSYLRFMDDEEFQRLIHVNDLRYFDDFDGTINPIVDDIRRADPVMGTENGIRDFVSERILKLQNTVVSHTVYDVIPWLTTGRSGAQLGAHRYEFKNPNSKREKISTHDTVKKNNHSALMNEIEYDIHISMPDEISTVHMLINFGIFFDGHVDFSEGFSTQISNDSNGDPIKDTLADVAQNGVFGEYDTKESSRFTKAMLHAFRQKTMIFGLLNQEGFISDNRKEYSRRFKFADSLATSFPELVTEISGREIPDKKKDPKTYGMVIEDLGLSLHADDFIEAQEGLFSSKMLSSTGISDPRFFLAYNRTLGAKIAMLVSELGVWTKDEFPRNRVVDNEGTTYALDFLPSFTLPQIDDSFMYDCAAMGFDEDLIERFVRATYVFNRIVGEHLEKGGVLKDVPLVPFYLEDYLVNGRGEENLPWVEETNRYYEVFRFARHHRNVLQREHCAREDNPDGVQHYETIAFDSMEYIMNNVGEFWTPEEQAQHVEEYHVTIEDDLMTVAEYLHPIRATELEELKQVVRVPELEAVLETSRITELRPANQPVARYPEYAEIIPDYIQKEVALR